MVFDRGRPRDAQMIDTEPYSQNNKACPALMMSPGATAIEFTLLPLSARGTDTATSVFIASSMTATLTESSASPTPTLTARTVAERGAFKGVPEPAFERKVQCLPSRGAASDTSN